jgi:signal transduction histidine kinase
MPRSFVERLFLVGVVLLPAVLLINAAVSHRDVQRLIDSEGQVTHTYRVLNTLQELLTLVQDAETGHRGYLITGVESYLDPYWDALPQIEGVVVRLDSLLADDPLQAERVETLHGHATRRLEHLAYSMSLYDAEGLAAAQALILAGAGTREMEAVRRQAAEIRSQEIARLGVRLDQAERSARRTFLTQIVSTFLALLLVVVLYFVFRQLLKTRQRATQALRQRRDELEGLVQERTHELAAANEGLLAEIAVRRHVERRLRAFTAELERSNRELEDFAFIASHDLQEPLRKIQVFGERVERRYGKEIPEPARQDLKRLRSAAARMRGLVNDLLAYSRVSRTGREPKPVDLTHAAGRAADDLSKVVERTGAHVEIGPLPTIEADPLQMRQLFQNLLSNALKFQQEGATPYIRVSASVNVEEVRIIVEDNGIGFDERYIDRIFTPFERLDTEGRFAGTGIGLAICRRIAEHHGGSITARSTPGEGSTFIVTLPLHASTRHHSIADVAAVDDDPHGR